MQNGGLQQYPCKLLEAFNIITPTTFRELPKGSEPPHGASHQHLFKHYYQAAFHFLLKASGCALLIVGARHLEARDIFFRIAFMFFPELRSIYVKHSHIPIEQPTKKSTKKFTKQSTKTSTKALRMRHEGWRRHRPGMHHLFHGRQQISISPRNFSNLKSN